MSTGSSFVTLSKGHEDQCVANSTGWDPQYLIQVYIAFLTPALPGCSHLPPHKTSAQGEFPSSEPLSVLPLEISGQKFFLAWSWVSASVRRDFIKEVPVLCSCLEGCNNSLSLRAALYFGESNDISPCFLSNALNIYIFFFL